MQRSLINAILLLAVPVTVWACEGECISGVTNAWRTNYTSPVHAVFENIAQQIVQNYFPGGSLQRAVLCLKPIIDAYDNQSYSGLETAIFPSYFHGKCQVDGVDPAGCPDPDCPVVCGTPGSLVHFFDKLRDIAFIAISGILDSLVAPGSDTYKKVEKAVYAEAAKSTIRRSHSRALWLSSRWDSSVDDLSLNSRRRRMDLKQILKQIGPLLEKECGGTNHTACSWEKSMKRLILSYR